MNEETLRTYCREHVGEELPAAARALLGREPELQQEVDRQVAVQHLMALKKHEQPDPGSLDRCLRGVNERLDARAGQSLFARIRAWFTYESPVPAYAYAVAALVVVGLGVTLYLEASDISGSAVAVESAPAVIEPVLFASEPDLAATNDAVIAATEPVVTKPIIMLRVNADEFAPPGGMTFGGDSSMPVSYER